MISTRRSSPAFVGRAAEIAGIHEAVASRAERPVVLVGGEAGIGKSRLVAEALRRVNHGGVLSVVGSCVGLGADVLPYAPFVESLGRLIDAVTEGERTALLGRGTADLAPLLPALRADQDDMRASGPGRMFEAVRAMLDRAPDPLVVVVEDLHWADASSLALFDYLARRLRNGRCLLVATFRTDEIHRGHPLVPVLAEMARSGRSTRIDLGPLALEDIAGIVRGIRGASAPSTLVDTVAGRSEGNPFFAEELLATETGRDGPLPASLRGILSAGLGSLPASTRDVLGIVAAVGRPADPALIALAWAGPRDVLDQALGEALDRGLLVAGRDDRLVAFRHDLLREAADDALLPGERAAVHGRLARALVDSPGLASPTEAGAAAEIARHWLEAGDLPAAFATTVHAAKAAAHGRAFAEARLLAERALELWDRVPEPARSAGIDRADLLGRAARAALLAGDAGPAASLGRRAVEASERDGDPARTGYFIARLLESVEEAGGHAELASLAERAVSLVPADPPSPQRAWALAAMAAARMHRNRFAATLQAADEAIRVAAACGAKEPEAWGRSVRSICLEPLGQEEEALAEAERAVKMAEASGASDMVLIAHANRVEVMVRLGPSAEAEVAIADARAAADREGLQHANEPWIAALEVELAAAIGRWSDVEALAMASLDGDPPVGPRRNLLVARGTTRVLQGRVDDGVRDLEAALVTIPDFDLDVGARARVGLVEAALVRRRPREALDVIDDGLAALADTDEIEPRCRFAALALRAIADLADLSRVRRAPAVQERLAARAREHLALLDAAVDCRLVIGAVPDERVRLAAAWGMAEQTRIAGASDPWAWATAAQAAEASQRPWLTAYARYRESQALLGSHGGPELASASLRLALDDAVALGAFPLRMDIDSLARRARIRLARRQPLPGPAAEAPSWGARRAAGGDRIGLSPREREVLALLVDGRTNREIGASLFISEKTASVHVTHILDKLGVRSRGAAAAMAGRSALLWREVSEPTA